MSDPGEERDVPAEPHRPPSSPPCALESDDFCPNCGTELVWRDAGRRCPVCAYEEGRGS